MRDRGDDAYDYCDYGDYAGLAAFADVTASSKADAQAAQRKAQRLISEDILAKNADLSAQLSARLPGVDLDGVSNALLTGRTLSGPMLASLTNLSDRNFLGAAAQLSQLAAQYKQDADDSSAALGALVSSAGDAAQIVGIVAAASSKAMSMLSSAKSLADDPNLPNIIAFENDLANTAASVGSSLTGLPIASAKQVFDLGIAQLRKVSPILADGIQVTALSLALGPAGLIAASAVADWETQPQMLTIGELAGVLLFTLSNPIGWAAGVALGGRALFCSLFSGDNCGQDEKAIQAAALQNRDLMYTLQFNLMVSAVPAMQCFAAVYPDDPNVKNTSCWPVPFHLDNSPDYATTRYDPYCQNGTRDLPARCANLMVYIGGMDTGPNSIVSHINKLGKPTPASPDDLEALYQWSLQHRYGMTTNQAWGLTYGMGDGYTIPIPGTKLRRRIPLFNMDGNGLPGYYAMILQWYRGQMTAYGPANRISVNPDSEADRNNSWRAVADWLIATRKDEQIAQAAKKAAAIVLQRNLSEKAAVVDKARMLVLQAKAAQTVKQAQTEYRAAKSRSTALAVGGLAAAGLGLWALLRRS
jgi:hypothetical protein